MPRLLTFTFSIYYMSTGEDTKEDRESLTVNKLHRASVRRFVLLQSKEKLMNEING